MKLNVRGTEYTLTVKSYDEDPYFKETSCDGYCDGVTKEISICKLSTYPGYEKESDEYCAIVEKSTKRHEIIHAFLNESGLQSSSVTAGPWARNEEMVDWFAIQSPKIYEAFKTANCL